MKSFLWCLLFLIISILSARAQKVVEFNKDWEFVKDIDTTISAKSLSDDGQVNISWEKISLPHTAHIEPVNKVVEQWQGTCFYRIFFTIAQADNEKHIAIQLDAAMKRCRCLS